MQYIYLQVVLFDRIQNSLSYQKAVSYQPTTKYIVGSITAPPAVIKPFSDVMKNPDQETEITVDAVHQPVSITLGTKLTTEPHDSTPDSEFTSPPEEVYSTKKLTTESKNLNADNEGTSQQYPSTELTTELTTEPKISFSGTGTPATHVNLAFDNELESGPMNWITSYLPYIVAGGVVLVIIAVIAICVYWRYKVRPYKAADSLSSSLFDVMTF